MNRFNLKSSLSNSRSTTVLAAIQTIVDEIPFMIQLTKHERQVIFKLGDKTQSFVNKTLDYAEHYPDKTPKFFDFSRAEMDLELYNDLHQILRKLRPIVEMLDDTAMAAGSDALNQALGNYDYLKICAKNGDPGTDAMVDDLKKRFPGGGSGLDAAIAKSNSKSVEDSANGDAVGESSTTSGDSSSNEAA